MGLTITLDERALRKYLDTSIRSWPQAAEGALARVGKIVYDETQRQVPKGKTRRLQSQSMISIAPRTVYIVYSAPYARIVHFRKHVKHKEGKRLFVSSPLGKGRRVLPFEIQSAIQVAMDRG